MTSARSALVAFLCAVFALFVGAWLGGHPERPRPDPGCPRGEDQALRAEVVDSIEQNFYKRVDEESLEDASPERNRGSVNDPFSHYLTPKGVPPASTNR